MVMAEQPAQAAVVLVAPVAVLRELAVVARVAAARLGPGRSPRVVHCSTVAGVSAPCRLAPF